MVELIITIVAGVFLINLGFALWKGQGNMTAKSWRGFVLLVVAMTIVIVITIDLIGGYQYVLGSFVMGAVAMINENIFIPILLPMPELEEQEPKKEFDWQTNLYFIGLYLILGFGISLL